ncbi:AAA family ATPase [Hydrogenophaga sp.]|jgi:cobaltochelatase CobS|uniref:AAA family ATPase n=1 Tax=Hydrogenophaga sp. TaxID=1904254 RepID=UPI0026247933|nr:AAA family ATPase [Hydrogenophaga sp.]
MENKTPAIQKYNVRTTFGLAEAPEHAAIPGLVPGLEGVPPTDPSYVFDAERMRQLTMFWVGGFKALLIEGDPAAGKTSLIEQWHARLNVPLYKVPCSPTTESFRLIGQLLPTEDGRLAWKDGPVVKACRDGTSVLLDEYNTLDPGEATGLNMLLEGYSWTIPETGETITPAPTTRFFGTQNAVDSRVSVSGRNVQDTANDDRWSYMEVDYLKAELEEALVLRHLLAGKVDKAIAEPIAKVCVRVANSVRQAFRDDAPGVDKPLSTRAVLRWAKYTVMFQSVMKAQGRSGLHYAIRQAVRMSSSMAKAVNEQITLLAGYDENLNS